MVASLGPAAAMYLGFLGSVSTWRNNNTNTHVTSSTSRHMYFTVVWEIINSKPGLTNTHTHTHTRKSVLELGFVRKMFTTAYGSNCLLLFPFLPPANVGLFTEQTYSTNMKCCSNWTSYSILMRLLIVRSGSSIWVHTLTHTQLHIPPVFSLPTQPISILLYHWNYIWIR